MSADTTTRPSFLDRQRDAALAEIREQYADRHRVEEIVLGPNKPGRPNTKTVTNVIKLADGDYLVEVTDRRNSEKLFATVVGDKADANRFYSQDEAMLYLITRRQQPRGDVDAVTYAARVLGMPITD